MKRSFAVFLALLVVIILAGIPASAQTTDRVRADNPNGNYNPTYNPNQIALQRWYHGNAAPTVFTVPNNFEQGTTGTEGIAFDGTNMWVASYNTGILNVLSINGVVLDTIRNLGIPLSLTYDGANIWVASRGVTAGKAGVYKVSVATHVVTRISSTGLTDPYKLAFDGTNIWVTGANDNKVVQLTTDGRLLHSFSLPQPRGLASDGDCMWVATAGDSQVHVFGTTSHCAFDGRAFPCGGEAPFNVVYDGTNMWVTNEDSNNVAELDGVYGAGVLQTVQVGHYPQGLAFDGAYIWVASIFSNQIHKIMASNNPLGRPGTVVAVFQTAPSGAYSDPNELAFDGANIWATLGGSLVGKF